VKNSMPTLPDSRMVVVEEFFTQTKIVYRGA
jgi:hypothetical protein